MLVNYNKNTKVTYVSNPSYNPKSDSWSVTLETQNIYNNQFSLEEFQFTDKNDMFEFINTSKKLIRNN